MPSGHHNLTYAAWSFFALAEMRLPIFSTLAATLNAKGNLDEVFDTVLSSGLSLGAAEICYGNGLFVVSTPNNGNANVSTSPDGTTWTLRAMPASNAWMVRNNGANFFAVANTGTATANSTNGTTWASATAVPVAAAVKIAYSSAGVILIP